MEEKRNEQKNISAQDLFEAIGQVDEALLQKVEEAPRVVPFRRKIAPYMTAVAAVLVVLGLTGLWAARNRMSSSDMAPAAEAPAVAEEAVVTEEAVVEEAAAGIEEADLGEASPAEADLQFAADEAPAEEAKEAGGAMLGAAQENAAYDAADAEEARSDTTASSAEKEEVMNIQVSDGTYTVVFRLNDSNQAKSLYALLPFETEVENYGSTEKVFTPPSALDKTGGIEGGGKAGGIAYFSPWGNIAMYYGDFSSYPGLYLMGEAVSGAEHIQDLSGTIRIEAVK